MVLSDLDPAGTCAHMNADHAESLKAYLMFFANIKDCEKGEMLDVDEKGCFPDGFRVVVPQYGRTAQSSSMELVGLHARCC